MLSTLPSIRSALRALVLPLAWLTAAAPALAQQPAPAPPPPAPPPPGATSPDEVPPAPPPPPAPPLGAAPGADFIAPKPSPFARETPAPDPTGGAWTTPTLLFIPAGAVPVWNVRVIASLDMQGPTPPDRLASGAAATTSETPLARFGIEPGLGLELGLPGGFTLGGGTNWVGGDLASNPISGGLSPYFQLRYHILGDKTGLDWQLGASATYKFVGFEGDPGEMELAFSAQYRRPHYEIGLQGVLGKDFATTDADAELHLYAVYRVIPQLALGVAGQGRAGIVHDPTEPPVDLISGAIASLTLGRWQVAGLAGESTLNLSNGPIVRVGGYGEVFASARF